MEQVEEGGQVPDAERIDDGERMVWRCTRWMQFPSFHDDDSAARALGGHSYTQTVHEK